MYNPSFRGEVCSHRHAFVLDNFVRRLFQNPRKIVGPYIHAGDTVIDLGCGPGYFSIDMAAMVKENGRVFAVDLQEEMLSKVANKAALKNLSRIIHTHRATQAAIGLSTEIQADFILAYYMVHETLDRDNFFSQVHNLLSPSGRFLVVEPPFHVSARKFERIVQSALENGFEIKARPKKMGGKSVLLGKTA